MGEELKLIFIHHCGSDWNGNNTKYQLLFATDEDIEMFDDDSWGLFPAKGLVATPPSSFITQIMNIETEISLILAQNSMTFRMYDAVDGIIPLGYEDINNYDYYPDFRLVLHYGMTEDEVMEALSKSDISPEIQMNDEKEID